MLRGGQVVFHSPQQQHDFNFPFQIGSFDSMSDPPQASQRFELLTQPGGYAGCHDAQMYDGGGWVLGGFFFWDS